MINISVSPKFRKFINKVQIVQIVEKALLFESVNPEENELSILIRNDEFLRKLKKQHFGIDETTDVLSFPSGFDDPETGNTYLGDIIISLPQTQKQAQETGKLFEDELDLLIVHGVLHLLGYDHADEQTQKAMWEKQDVILAKKG